MTDNCKHVQKIKTSIQLGILNPEQWHCNTCHTTESVWACLSCTNFACGRYIAEHALQHFEATGHPLCIEVNEKFVFCYICDDFVLNDNAPGDIKLLRMALDAITAQNFEDLSKRKRGRRILRISQRLLKADDVHNAVARHRLSRLSWALRTWWSRYLEKKQFGACGKLRATSSKRKSPLTLSAAFTGLRNLGNTCYMNSVLQILRHTAPFANYVISHEPSEVLPKIRKRRWTAQTTDQSDLIYCPLKRSVSHQLPSSRSPSLSSSIQCSQDYSVPDIAKSVSPSNHLVSFGTPSETVKSTCAHNFNEFKKTVSKSSLDTVGGLNGGRCAMSAANGLASKLSTSTTRLLEQEVPNHSLYEELHKILRTMWTGHRTVISPSSLLYSVWNALPSFKGYKQQDAQEFLSVFLDRLQSEVHATTSPVPVTSRDFINRTFQGYLVSHIRCSNCNQVACTEEPFSELSLALPSTCYTGESTECDIMELLHQFVSPTLIDGKSYACQQCNRRQIEFGCNDSKFHASSPSIFHVKQVQVNSNTPEDYESGFNFVRITHNIFDYK